MEGLAQSVACALLALFGPEHDEETVTPVHAARPCGGEVGEQGQGLGRRCTPLPDEPCGRTSVAPSVRSSIIRPSLRLAAAVAVGPI